MKENKNLELKEEITNTFLKTVQIPARRSHQSGEFGRCIPVELVPYAGATVLTA